MHTDTNTLVGRYFASLERLGTAASATDRLRVTLPLGEALDRLVATARETHARHGKLMFIGNGGSASIASHMAIDYSKAGGMRSLCFNDGAALTCLGNDLGYDSVFAEQIRLHGRPDDLLIAISSSGRSANILKAVEAARSQGCRVVTLSGFDPENALRRTGDINIHVASDRYGFVEITHLALLHAALDIAVGWTGADG